MLMINRYLNVPKYYTQLLLILFLKICWNIKNIDLKEYFKTIQ